MLHFWWLYRKVSEDEEGRRWSRSEVKSTGMTVVAFGWAVNFFFFFNEMRQESHDVLFCLILFFEMVAARPSSQNN